MKSNRPIAIVTAWLAFAICVGHAADASATTGIIEGRVFNAATGTALANVRVAIPGTNHESLTDEGGRYRLIGLGAGETRLTADYVGLESQSIAVQVAPGGTVQRDIELQREGSGKAQGADAIVQLRAVTVVEDREMSAQALAINEQRHAPNIKNVVARDEFDYRGNENIGDFLAFLPGVGITNSGIEPQYVSLRGLPPSTSGLLLDGGEVASSQEGNAREINLREVPMVNVSRVEITKVPTPDMSAAGLGGSINLVTNSGFESKRRKLAYNVYTLFPSSEGLSFDGGPRNHRGANSPSTVEPSFDLSYLHPITKSFAITAGLSRTWRQRPMWEREDNMFGETATWDLVRNVQTRSQFASLAQLYKTFSGQIGAEWRLGPNDNLSASFQYREYSRDTTRTAIDVNFGAGAIGDASFVQGLPAGTGTSTQGLGWDSAYNENRQLTLKYRHRGDVWNWSAQGSWSAADAYRKDIDNGYFAAINSAVANLIIRGEAIGVSGGLLPNRFNATSRTGQAVDLYDGGNYSIPSATSAQSRNETTKQSLRVDVSRNFAARIPVAIKVGASVDQMEKDLRGFAKSWNFRPNGSADVNARLAGNFDVFDEAFLATAPTLFGVKYREISNEKLYQLYQKQPTWFVLDEPGAHQNVVNNSRELEETISASYVRVDLRLLESRLWLVTGVRFEQTDGKGLGPLNDINAQYQRDARGEFVRNAAGQRILITNDELALRRLRFQERAARAESRYSGYYPSLNATYHLTANLLLRAAYAKTLGRPNLSFIVPGSTVSEPDVATPTVTVNNAALKPWTAHGYDLTLEAYNIKGGTGSISVFQKDIKDFFGAVSLPATPELLAQYGVPDDGTLGRYTIVTRHNIDTKTRVRGTEFAYRQPLTFLPSWARGFQVFFNATKLSLSGSNTADFDGYKPSYYAGGLNFIRPRYYVKMTYTYEGETRLAAVGASATVPPDTFSYAAKRTRIGISAQYSINSRYSLYMSLPDVNGFEKINRRYGPNTPDYASYSDRNDLGYYTTIGIRGTF